MKIGDALKTTSDLLVPFGDATLRLTYRPSSVTIADIEALKADRDIKRVAEQVREQVVQWDLTDDYDRLIPLEKPVPKIIESDPESGAVSQIPAQDDPLHAVPISILTKVLIAIQMDQRPSPEA